ncbi:MAG: OsmC family protein [Caldisericia bacterium]|nr:OsmC family protein [Caldisericia bacterium]
MPIQTFKAVSNQVEGLTVDNKTRNFSMVMDEPPSLGGTDKGMTPVEALLCALGSCQCVVGAAFAKQFEIELKGIWAEIEGDLDPDGFLRGLPGVPVGFKEVRIYLHIKADIDEEKKMAFANFIEERCPVGKTMSLPTTVKLAEVILEK